MASRLKVAALWFGVVLLIWVTVGGVWYWRSHEPSNSDLLWGLVGVPVLLIAGYALLKRVLSGMLSPPVLAAPEMARTAAPSSSVSTAVTPASQMQLLILGGNLKMPAGGAQELLHACSEGVRPELDERLRDGQGFPLMAARVVELDDSDTLEWWDGADLDAVLPNAREWISQLPDARVREMRLLADVLADSAAALERDLLLWAESQPPAKQQAELRMLLPLVQVRLALEPGWVEDDLTYLQSWARVWLERSAPALRFDVQRYPVAKSQSHNLLWPAALLDANEMAFPSPSMVSGAREELWLLASAHSDVSQSAVDGLAAEGRLYGAKRREGWIVGEGAAALLLMRYQPGPGASSLVAQLQGGVVASAKIVPASEAAGQLAQRLVAPMLEACAIPASNVGKVFSDADHRAACAMDNAMLLAQQFPRLSVEKDCAMVGVPSGHTAGVAALASLILAADFAMQEQSAALAVTLASDSWRGAALLMPPSWGTAAVDAQAQTS